MVETWARGHLGQWRSMGAVDRARYVSALRHFARMNENEDGAACLRALQLIEAAHRLEVVADALEAAAGAAPGTIAGCNLQSCEAPDLRRLADGAAAG